MNTQWCDFLTDRGARITDDTVTDFGSPETEISAAAKGTLICDLSHYGIIRVSGEDAPTFLHNQFTNDLKALAEGDSQLSAYCSPKGRMLAVFRVLLSDGAYHLVMPKALIATTLKRLTMFVMMSKVTLEDVSDTLVHVGCAGENAPALISALGLPCPQTTDQVTHGNGLTVVKVPGEIPRFELFADTDTMGRAWAAFAEANPVGHDGWALQEIRQGLPCVFEQTVEAFVPQMANLQAVNGLSFKKGCYPGQEIVARMQYLGKLKRRLYRLETDGAARPTPGDPVYSLTDDAPHNTGTVVNAAPKPQGGYELLAILEIAHAEADALSLNPADTNATLRQLDLPYIL